MTMYDILGTKQLLCVRTVQVYFTRTNNFCAFLQKMQGEWLRIQLRKIKLWSTCQG